MTERVRKNKLEDLKAYYGSRRSQRLPLKGLQLIAMAEVDALRALDPAAIEFDFLSGFFWSPFELWLCALFTETGWLVTKLEPMKRGQDSFFLQITSMTSSLKWIGLTGNGWWSRWGVLILGGASTFLTDQVQTEDRTAVIGRSLLVNGTSFLVRVVQSLQTKVEEKSLNQDQERVNNQDCWPI